MAKLNVLSGGVLLGVAAFVCRGALDLSLGSLRAPEPGLYPLLLGVVLGALALALVGIGLQAWRRRAEGAVTPPARATVVTTVTLLAYAALLPAVGYGLATTAALTVLLRVGGTGLRASVPLAVALTGVTWLAAAGLGITLPRGLLFPGS